MRLLIGFATIAAAASLLLACPLPKLTEPGYVEKTTDAGDYPFPPFYVVEELPEGSSAAALSPCGQACAALRTIGCSEGFPNKQGVTCYAGCLSMAKQQRIPTSCWTLSRTSEDVRRCGGARCLPTPRSATRDSSPN